MKNFYIFAVHGKIRVLWGAGRESHGKPIYRGELYLEEYYTEPDLIKKPEVEEYDELSDDEISEEFVPVEDGEETSTVEVRKPNDNKKTNTVVEADERNDDDE